MTHTERIERLQLALAGAQAELEDAKAQLAIVRAENKSLRERLGFLERAAALRASLSTVFVFHH